MENFNQITDITLDDFFNEMRPVMESLQDVAAMEGKPLEGQENYPYRELMITLSPDSSDDETIMAQHLGIIGKCMAYYGKQMWYVYYEKGDTEPEMEDLLDDIPEVNETLMDEEIEIPDTEDGDNEFDEYVDEIDVGNGIWTIVNDRKYPAEGTLMGYLMTETAPVGLHRLIYDEAEEGERLMVMLVK